MIGPEGTGGAPLACSAEASDTSELMSRTTPSERRTFLPGVWRAVLTVVAAVVGVVIYDIVAVLRLRGGAPDNVSVILVQL